ncbi:superoxide dismutase [Roseomonas terrae]|jgi:Fe-Mn family superoxide dismutase|uniref:Superoxide dismutase n=1 Tax=Neoroseomonas terrae TaxID=424799 RepID=A0ABS5ENM6_9PROT|nr:superoxide dismutase [Neoroseomonas terrae]
MTMMNRRGMLVGAAGLLTAAAMRRPAYAQAPSGPFTLPPLPYAPNANERAIDAMTMEIHHGRHHAAYVANLNAAVKDHSALAQMPVDDLLKRLSEVPEAVRTAIRNNGGGHANHSMFWELMGGQGGEPTGELKAAIDRDLGGMEKFRTDFNGAGARVFGSGWVFVAVTPQGGLSLVSKPNQDTPLMDGGRVLMGNDVWEHAYYLRYQNRRADYLTAWWNVLNWGKIGERYAAAKAGTLRV